MYSPLIKNAAYSMPIKKLSNAELASISEESRKYMLIGTTEFLTKNPNSTLLKLFNIQNCLECLEVYNDINIEIVERFNNAVYEGKI